LALLTSSFFLFGPKRSPARTAPPDLCGVKKIGEWANIMALAAEVLLNVCIGLAHRMESCDHLRRLGREISAQPSKC
jgi:hypothetical protein